MSLLFASIQNPPALYLNLCAGPQVSQKLGFETGATVNNVEASPLLALSTSPQCFPWGAASPSGESGL